MKRFIFTCIFLFITFSLQLNTAGCANRSQDSTFTIAQKQKLTIGSTGANLPILKKLADSYMEKNNDVLIEIPIGLNNNEVVRNVEEGNLDLGLTTVPLAEDKTKTLQQKLFARTIAVVAVNPSVSISELSKQQVLGIFSGDITNWREVGGKDSKIFVLSNQHGMSTIMLMDKYIKGFKDLKAPADVIVLKNAEALNEAITSIRDSIGLSDIGAIKASGLKIKPLVIQGITPTSVSYETGEYPIAKNLYILVPQTSSVLANNFVDFILGWEGKKLIMENGYLSP